MQPARIHLIAKIVMIIGVVAFPVAYALSTVDSTAARAVGSVLLILAIPALLISVPTWYISRNGGLEPRIEVVPPVVTPDSVALDSGQAVDLSDSAQDESAGPAAEIPRADGVK